MLAFLHGQLWLCFFWPRLLCHCGMDVSLTDTDGWTAFHAAAHWGQAEACRILAEHLCNMEARSNAVSSSREVLRFTHLFSRRFCQKCHTSEMGPVSSSQGAGLTELPVNDQQPMEQGLYLWFSPQSLGTRRRSMFLLSPAPCQCVPIFCSLPSPGKTKNVEYLGAKNTRAYQYGKESITKGNSR